MKKFNQRGGNFGGRPGFGNRGDRGPVNMYEATCAECGNRCEVPFRPSGDKPVYCSNCFGAKREGGDRAPRRDFSRPSFGDRGSFDRNRDNRDARDNRNSGLDIKRELEVMSAKLAELTRSIDRLVENKAESKVSAKNDAKTIKVVVGESAKEPKKTAVKKVAAAKKKVPTKKK